MVDAAAGDDADARPAPPLLVHDEIFEVDIAEHVWKPVRPRVERFIAWLRARPESRIVVVGHSAFFRALLLPEPVRFTNCAVWRATLTATGEPAWRGAVELFPGWESFSEEDAAESTARETAAQSAPP